MIQSSQWKDTFYFTEAFITYFYLALPELFVSSVQMYVSYYLYIMNTELANVWYPVKDNPSAQ